MGPVKMLKRLFWPASGVKTLVKIHNNKNSEKKLPHGVEVWGGGAQIWYCAPLGFGPRYGPGPSCTWWKNILFSSFLTMRTFAQSCVRWSKYTTWAILHQASSFNPIRTSINFLMLFLFQSFWLIHFGAFSCNVAKQTVTKALLLPSSPPPLYCPVHLKFSDQKGIEGIWIAFLGLNHWPVHTYSYLGVHYHLIFFYQEIKF